MQRDLFRYLVILVCSLNYSITSFANDSTTKTNSNYYTLNQFITESISKHSGLAIATLNINKLAYELGKVESQLGWVATSQGGYSRTSSTFGIESDTVDFGFGLEKPLESGDTLSLSSRYAHSDTEQVLFSLAPNPAETTSVDLNYRIPLLEGKGNEKYCFDTKKASIEKQISLFEKEQIKENLILKLINIYYFIATIDSRLITAEKSLRRTNKLREYIKKNINLGLLEQGDIFQVDAQVYTLRLEKQKILDLREKQIIEINRFLNKPFSSEFLVSTSNLHSTFQSGSSAEIISKVKSHDYENAKLTAQAKLLESSLALSRSREKDKLDLILSLGIQNQSGSSSIGSLDDTDTVGMIKFEYRNALDKRSFSSQRLQIQIDREKNREQILSLNKDLEYETHRLLNQISKSKEIVALTEKRTRNETLKYRDILKRYKNGRSTTNIVIQFDNERIRSELDHETERHELAKRVDQLLLKQGMLLIQ